MGGKPWHSLSVVGVQALSSVAPAMQVVHAAVVVGAHTLILGWHGYDYAELMQQNAVIGAYGC